MTFRDALLIIIGLYDGVPTRGPAQVTYRFPTLADADACKVVLDALAPGFCGSVFGYGLLAVCTEYDESTGAMFREHSAAVAYTAAVAQ